MAVLNSGCMRGEPPSERLPPTGARGRGVRERLAVTPAGQNHAGSSEPGIQQAGKNNRPMVCIHDSIVDTAQAGKWLRAAAHATISWLNGNHMAP
jgi:hypothetical protein